MSISFPWRTTLSTTIRLPAWARSTAALKYSGVLRLSASMKTRSKGSPRSALSVARLSRAGADPHLDLAVEAGARDVAARDLGVVLLELEADQAAVVRQRAPHPDGAVAAERADLEDPAGVDRAREQVQKLSLRGRHGDVREAGAVPDRCLEHRVGRLQQSGRVRVDGVPAIVIHGPAVYRRRATQTSSDGQRLAQSRVTNG